MSIFTILTLIFVGLKLAGIGAVAAWSWWWVFSPLLLQLVILLLVFVGALKHYSRRSWR